MNQEQKYPDDIGRIMSHDEQLDKWIEGESIHNGKTRSEGECCPDFSCCTENNTPKDIRIAFKNADEETRMEMLMMFLGNAFSESKLHIAGQDYSKGEQ